MSGANIAAEVAAGIKAASSETGNGAALAGTIIRATGADETTYPPTPGSDEEYSCSLILSRYSARDRDGTEITARDVRVLIAPDAESAPRNGDRLRVGTETYHIVNVDALKPGGVVLMWEVQARSGS